MKTLILDKSNLELKTEGQVLVIYEDGVRKANMPIKSIERCVVMGSSIKMEAGVIQKIMEAGGSILMLSSRYHQRNAFILGNKHNDALIRIEQTSRLLDPQWCVDWSKAVVMGKLRQQLKCLNRLQKTRPEQRKAIFLAKKRIDEQLTDLFFDNLKVTDIAQRNTCLASLRGIEGSATRQWFGAMAQVFPSQLKFNSRNRRPPRDPVNVVLSLSYTLLHFEAMRAAHIAGLDPLIGFYHQPSYGRESLASDLIEGLRPDVDMFVLKLFTDKVLRSEYFGYEKDGACVMHKASRSTFYQVWELQAPIYRRYLRTYCRNVVKNFKQNQQLSLQFATIGDDDEQFES